MKTFRESVTPHDVRRIAAEAAVWDGTVRRYFKGLPVRSTCVARIEGALERLGLDRPAREGRTG